ncbi:MAG: acetate uptake transporter [Candidatus Thermoplasmatota archaeon]|nr:acetate uptake transporter [Candidatus Thermoplasmatota archaeon]MBU1941376.1 acetate uptake transporter [Candidatus Thermoplasmatota archaeon]
MKEKNSVKSETNLPLHIADPAPLGLIGLAVAALVLASTDLGFVSSAAKSLMIPWILFFGATAQLIAGTIEFKRNNIFGATVFTTYSMTMYAIALTLCITIFTGVAFSIEHYGFGLIAILIFSLIATIASLMTNKMLFIILLCVDLAVIALIPHYLYDMTAVPAGIFLFLTSVTSFYTAMAILLNNIAGKTILPLGTKIWHP